MFGYRKEVLRRLEEIERGIAELRKESAAIADALGSAVSGDAIPDRMSLEGYANIMAYDIKAALGKGDTKNG